MLSQEPQWVSGTPTLMVFHLPYTVIVTLLIVLFVPIPVTNKCVMLTTLFLLYHVSEINDLSLTGPSSEGNFYWYNSSSFLWMDADTYCKQKCGILAFFSSVNQYSFLPPQLPQASL